MQQIPFAFIKTSGAAWSPADLSLQAWFDATDTSTVEGSGGSTPADGQEVYDWRDKSSNSYDLNRNVAIPKGPNYDTSSESFNFIVNSGSVLDGLANKSASNIQQPIMTINMVFKMTESGTSVNNVLFSGQGGSGSGQEFLRINTISAGTSWGAFYKANVGYSFTTLSFDTWYFLQVRCDNTPAPTFGVIDGHINNSQVFSNLYLYTTNTGLVLFNDRGGTQGPNMAIAEFWIENGYMSTSDMTSAWAYVQDKYGI